MAGNLIVRQLLAVASLMTLSLAHGQAADDMSRYDQATDLARLAELENERMHYKLLRSGMQAPGALWAGLDAEIDGLPENRYRELESLVPMQRLALELLQRLAHPGSDLEVTVGLRRPSAGRCRRQAIA